MTTSKIVITCSPRVAPHLEKEVRQLGYQTVKTDHQSVELSGTFDDTLKLNLHLRTANRVLFHIKSFRADHPDQLYKRLRNIPWENYFDADGYISIKSFVSNRFIQDVRFASLRAKDAIADRFVDRFGKRPDSGKDLSKTVLFLHWTDEHASIYIDTSGETIAKHGYRKIPMKAPMMESLASATILTSQWDYKSHFLNPMCGSGTLAIEAAMTATHRAPGLMRDNFGFMHVKLYNPAVWEQLKTEAKSNIRNDIDFKIIASDLNPEAVTAAQRNAREAGVEHLIEFHTGDFRDIPVPEPNKGVIFINPEYGQRLGEEEKLADIYQEIGDFFKNKAQGYTGYIFTGNMNLAKKIGLRTKRRIEFFNGKIDCRLLEYELYAGSKKSVNLSK
ncbi:class I SAM-dependent RNA methyltransferase [Fulvivirga ulvae]|uniref:THUMP domain-containing class I SAM-dependent RNA methyltransferase n=1 Tax=Fulvivirga ulvae TaxID=2904245 RepID=UPI001F44FD97|nr:class I SAM-dependent RNA methyltransferase [Fulvivirga ulvae]UII32415.1 class I SAM-dependent RNA methyltransferase [Fulvivirga ulvae]